MLCFDRVSYCLRGGESADAKRRRAIKDFIAECYECTDIGVRRKLDFGTDKKQKPDVCPYLSMAAHPR